MPLKLAIFEKLKQEQQRETIAAVHGAIAEAMGNKSKAAKALGISRQYLYMLLDGQAFGGRLLTDYQKIKNHAMSAANHAVRTGRILREPCRDCRSENAEMHHPDYSKPLEVVWLCRKCHRAEHRRKFTLLKPVH